MKGFYALKIVAIMMAAQLIQTRHSTERQNMNEYKSSVNFIASIPGECARIKAEAIFYAASTKADCIANAVESQEIAENDAIDILYNAEQNSLIKKEASECKAQQILNDGPNHTSTAPVAAAAATKVGAELGAANALIAAQDVTAAALKAAQIGKAASMKAAEAVKAAALKAAQISEAAALAAHIHIGMSTADSNAEFLRAANQESDEVRLAGDLYVEQTDKAAALLSSDIKEAANLKGGYMLTAATLKGDQCIAAAQLVAGATFISSYDKESNFIKVDFYNQKSGLMYIGVGSAYSRAPTSVQLRSGVDGNGHKLLSMSSFYNQSKNFTKRLHGNSQNSYKIYYFVRSRSGESKVSTIRFDGF